MLGRVTVLGVCWDTSCLPRERQGDLQAPFATAVQNHPVDLWGGGLVDNDAKA